MKLTEFTDESNLALTLSALDGDVALVERLQEMGLSEGLELTLLHRLPLGGAWLVQFHSTFLALRENEAAALRVRRKE